MVPKGSVGTEALLVGPKLTLGGGVTPTLDGMVLPLKLHLLHLWGTPGLSIVPRCSVVGGQEFLLLAYVDHHLCFFLEKKDLSMASVFWSHPGLSAVAHCMWGCP